MDNKKRKKLKFKGVKNMNNNIILEKEPKTLDCIIKIRDMTQKTIKAKGLTESDIRKSLGIKRYEK